MLYKYIYIYIYIHTYISAKGVLPKKVNEGSAK